jgi:hypothetical protein
MIWGLFTAVTLFGSPAVASAAPYGTTGTLGPAGAPVRTCDGVPNCQVLGPSDAWETAIQTATPGATILLRGGTYSATTTLTVPNGTSTALITVGNYNGEIPVLPRTVAPGNFNLIQGLDVEAYADDFAVEVSSFSSTPKKNVRLDHLRVRGGLSEAVYFKGNLNGVTLENSRVDGGRDHHTLLVECNADVYSKCTLTPEKIVVRNNRFSKRLSTFFPRPNPGDECCGGSGDLIQLEGVGSILVEHNEFGESDYEQCLDIKPTGRDGATLTVKYNIVDGRHPTNGFSNDPGCFFGALLWTQNRGDGTDLIEGNYLRGDAGQVRNTATNAQMINNFVEGDIQRELTLASKGNHLRFAHNTLVNTQLTFGDSTGRPTDLNVVNNIFSHVFFAGRSGTYHPVGNLLFQTSGETLGSCLNCVSGDPLLFEGYKLAEGSPAIGAASTTFTVAVDIEGTTRPQGFVSDIGAFEFAGAEPPPSEPTATLTGNPTTIDPGGSSTLEWSSTNAATCAGTGFDTGDATSGQVVITPAATTTYEVDCDAAVASATITVQEQPPPGEDEIPPQVNILSPADGSSVRRQRKVLIEIEASDDESGIASVQLIIEGVPIDPPFTGAGPYTYTWRPAGGPNRMAAIEAIATDNATNTANDVVHVTVTR